MQIFIPLHTPIKDNRICITLDKPAAQSYLTLTLHDGQETEYDIEIGAGGGSADAAKIFFHAKRAGDEDNATDPEFYTQRGRNIAASLKFSNAQDYLAAWYNEINKQINIGQDIHGILSLNILPKLPQWIRMDVFSLLESEAMKQVFAAQYFKQTTQALPPDIKEALRRDEAGNTNLYLSKMMEELFQKPLRYKNSAQNFVTNLIPLQNTAL